MIKIISADNSVATNLKTLDIDDIYASLTKFKFLKLSQEKVENLQKPIIKKVIEKVKNLPLIKTTETTDFHSWTVSKFYKK